MSELVIHPTPKEWDVLRSLLARLGRGGVIVAPEARKLAVERGLEFPDRLDYYDYGGDPDVLFDVVYGDEDWGWYLAFGPEEANWSDEFGGSEGP